MGIIGIVLAGLWFLIKLSSIEIFDIPYLTPYAPFSFKAIRDSFYQAKIKNDKYRNEYLSNNLVKEDIDD